MLFSRYSEEPAAGKRSDEESLFLLDFNASETSACAKNVTV